jgi:hypothetical protein
MIVRRTPSHPTYSPVHLRNINNPKMDIVNHHSKSPLRANNPFHTHRRIRGR